MENNIERLKHDLDVSVIVTFENQVDQVCWFIKDGWIYNPRFSKYIKRTTPNHSYNGKYLPQKHIMERIYNHLVEKGHDVTDVMKISLSYKSPDYVKRDTTKELWESGYGYMMKYHQYTFQPDQRGYIAVVDEGWSEDTPLPLKLNRKQGIEHTYTKRVSGFYNPHHLSGKEKSRTSQRICVLSSMVEDFSETFGFGKNVKPAKEMNYREHSYNLFKKQRGKEKLQF
jgi:hypothetical protein